MKTTEDFHPTTIWQRWLVVASIACALAFNAHAQIPAPRPTPMPVQVPTPTPTPIPTPSPTPKATPSPKPAAPTGEEINEARDLLGALGFWVIFAEEHKDGRIEQNQKFDTSMRHALIAFQKITGRKRTGVITADELQALRKAKRHEALESGYAHIEVDLAQQVLLIVDSCGACLRILPISSGSGEWFTEGGRTRRAVTPVGRFKVERKIAGWRKSALGLLYYPNYIVGGYAIHGNPSVPPQPASHGCIRIPMFAAKAFAEMAVIGLPVIIHDGKPSVEKPIMTARQ
jgi:lipoprotein-anchoring transpeptidase ErfK/SrfK